MSALIYKQRFFHPNHPKTAVSNYVHIGYIATRPGAVKHPNKTHGLFGKLEPGSLQAFDSWQDVARVARQMTREGKNMYRSVLSFQTDTALDLELHHFSDWQHYIEQHIATIAAKNQIKIENLSWAAAFHNERNHPHLHIVFWDRSQSIIKNFTHPEIPNQIRKQLIKDSFAYQIQQFCLQRDLAKSSMTEMTDELVGEFERYLKQLKPRAFREMQKHFEQEDEISLLHFPKHHLIEPDTITHFAKELFHLRQQLPRKGRLAYQLLPAETKQFLNQWVQHLLQTQPYLAQQVKDYVTAKLQVARLYASNPEHLEKQRSRYQAEAEKRVANRILSTLRTIIKLEKETATALWQTKRQYAIAEQCLTELLSMMEHLAMQAQWDADDKQPLIGGELSKQAKKEWLLRNQDKGMER